ncbi:MAG: discoidin domain-containing protein [bacterium]|nr:discoidin domain-containing protein [bacterium]
MSHVKISPVLKWSGLTFLLAATLFGIYLRVTFFNVSITHLPTITDEALNMLMARDIANGNYPLLFWTQPYQFPLEAYLLSLFVDFLPPDAFGARFILAVISCLSLFGFALIYRYSSSLKECWPGLLLILIPSTYFLMRQAAFIIPQYTTTITFAWALPLLFAIGRYKGKEHLWAIPMGLAAGMALSTHLLSLPIVAMVAMAICWGTSFKSALKNTLFFMPSFLLGMIPYLMAMRLPNAYEKVTDTVSALEALSRLWDPIIFKILPITLGISPCLFPDMDFRWGTFAFLVKPFLYFFIVVLIVLTGARIWRFIQLIRNRIWPSLELHDIFLGAIWLSLVLAALAGFGVKYRYLLPVAWYFPFLMGFLYTFSKRISARVIVGTIVVSIALINVYNSIDVMRHWEKPRFSDGIPRTPALTPLLKYLEENNITHCYGSWWLIYRISFESAGKVICSQPFNERFPGWPLSPLLKEVDSDPNAAYVTLKDSGGVFQRGRFNRLLAKNQLTADQVSIGAFVVFRNFRLLSGRSVSPVNPSSFRVSTNNNSQAVNNLVDGQIDTLWESSLIGGKPWIQIDFNKPTTIHFVRLYSNAKHFYKDTHRVKIAILQNGKWREIVSGSKGLMHRVRLGSKSRFPGHQYTELTFGFLPERTTAIKLYVAKGAQHKVWGLRQIEVYEVTDKLSVVDEVADAKDESDLE